MGVGAPNVSSAYPQDAAPLQLDLRPAAEWCSDSEIVQKLVASAGSVATDPDTNHPTVHKGPVVQLAVTAPTSHQFSELTQLLNASDSLVVITEGGIHSHFIGLCRTARNELCDTSQ